MLFTKLETEQALSFIKSTFSRDLKRALGLYEVSAPLAVRSGTGINDDLNGTELPVSFALQEAGRGEVVHSLAKWKRLRLQQLGVGEGEGILTDMRALRAQERPGPLHSIYVDQWDWEKRMHPGERSPAYLKGEVRKIYAALKSTEKSLCAQYPNLTPHLPETITFLWAEELLQRYPHLTPKEREAEATRRYGAVFIMGIGGALSNGEPHDGRAPDYDDWSTPQPGGFCGLNGDILLWHSALEAAIEISSMGIRVARDALMGQLKTSRQEHRLQLPFHQLLLEGRLPQSIGGGIGQSRLCMFLLGKVHIGEVQVSIWPETYEQELVQSGIALL